MSNQHAVRSSEVAKNAAEKIVERSGSSIYAAIIDALVDGDRNKKRIITQQETDRRTGTKDKWRRTQEARGEFPSRVPLSDRLTGYLEEEVEEWIEQRVSQRDKTLKKRRSPNPQAKLNRKEAARAAREEARKT